MSDCLPSRFDVKSTERLSRMNDGWLSYPGLAEMLLTDDAVHLAASVSETRKTSVDGGACVGGGVACGGVWPIPRSTPSTMIARVMESIVDDSGLAPYR